MTNEKELRELLGKEIMTEIDFLCDHWVTNDNKAPYTFGGWRGEVQEKLVDIYLSKLHSHTKEVVKKISGWADENKCGCVNVPCDIDDTLTSLKSFLASLEDNKK